MLHVVKFCCLEKGNCTYTRKVITEPRAEGACEKIGYFWRKFVTFCLKIITFYWKHSGAKNWEFRPVRPQKIYFSKEKKIKFLADGADAPRNHEQPLPPWIRPWSFCSWIAVPPLQNFFLEICHPGVFWSRRSQAGIHFSIRAFVQRCQIFDIFLSFIYICGIFMRNKKRTEFIMAF